MRSSAWSCRVAQCVNSAEEKTLGSSSFTPSSVRSASTHCHRCSTLRRVHDERPSMTVTLTPRRASSTAHRRPTGPAPTMVARSPLPASPFWYCAWLSRRSRLPTSWDSRCGRLALARTRLRKTSSECEPGEEPGGKMLTARRRRSKAACTSATSADCIKSLNAAAAVEVVVAMEEVEVEGEEEVVVEEVARAEVVAAAAE